MFNREEYILSDSPIKAELLRLFKKKQKLIIIDIGGCEGEESIRYSRLFPDSSIFCFEPLPKNQKKIEENIAKYNIKNVQLIPDALSDEEGEQQFYVSSGRPNDVNLASDWDFGNKSSSLLPPDKHLELYPWVKFKEVIKVNAQKLSSFVIRKNIFEIDFIHMDVQGAELKVLVGAESFMKKIKVIWLEVSDVALYQNQPIKTDIEIFMKKNGFYLFKTTMEGNVGDQMYINKKYFRLVSIFSRFFYLKNLRLK